MVAGYLVGGKTGTSEKVNARGGYNRKALLNTFVAAFPMNAPRYVVLALLDEPKPTKETHGFATAGWTAAPTASRIIARIAPLLGVEPVDEQAAEIRQAMFVNINGRTERKLAAY
jgi:cell division protein FtsI (penicillin-binding protein 3)